MPALRTIWMVAFVLALGCSWINAAPPSVLAQSAPLIVDPSLVGLKQTPSVVAEPPLDITALKARLQNSNAIGVFTKLALENQMDDLLSKFRTHYPNGQTSSVAPLRQPYDMLVQDIDPPLSRMILGSREAIWGIRADPDQFSALT